MFEIKKYIDCNICKINNICDISKKFEIDRNILSNYFNVIFGASPKEYILCRKMEYLVSLIKNSSVDNIAFFYAHELGFRTSGGLFHLVKRKTGLTFLEFKNKVLDKKFS